MFLLTTGSVVQIRAGELEKPVFGRVFMPKNNDYPVSGVRKEPDTNPEPQKNLSIKHIDFTTSNGENFIFDSWEDFEKYCDSRVEEDEQDDNKEPRNFWNFRVLEEIENGVSLFSIIEVYYKDGKISDYIDTHQNILGGWDTYDYLKGTWELVKGAFNLPIVRKDEKGFLYEDKK